MTHIPTQKIEQAIDSTFKLPATGSWPETQHRLDKAAAYAIIAAVSTRRPLLVRGEPGVGKSQLARAAAHLLERCFISAIVQPNSDYEELLWSFDHTQRLADAQLASRPEAAEKVQEPANYIAPGALWYALNWQQAAGMSCRNHFQPPEELDEQDTAKGLVLLIDEIDKADISLANGLLEVLGNGSFAVPPLGITVKSKQQPPLVILTSNDTRALPEALQRRCVVLEITLPSQREALENHLVEVGAAHHPEMDRGVLEEAARQIVEDRNRSQSRQKTGQAEYLDLLRALDSLSSDRDEQAQWLDKLADCFKKR